ncbi:MAG: outer membrane lipoprotein carrier protein LolA [candidate division KSB1 bacterium]|nr:outer membrane lipoprotein carrier protein LolA [candidate division KSB1 bacterium]
MRGSYGICWLIVIGLFAGTTRAQTADEIARKTRQRYESIRYLSLRFEQVFEWKLTGERQQLEGTVQVAPGERYRVETPSQLIVCDGKTVWTFNRPIRQVVIDRLGEDRTPLLRDLVLRYLKEYSATLAGEEPVDGKPCWVLRLRAKSPAELVEEITVWVDRERYIVWQTEEVDANGNRNRYRVLSFQEPSNLPEVNFQFQMPASVEIVDLRMQ